MYNQINGYRLKKKMLIFFFLFYKVKNTKNVEVNLKKYFIYIPPTYIR